MNVIEFLLLPFKAIAERIAVYRRLSHFTCGDCDRYEVCGQPPSEQCAFRHAYIAQYGNRAKRRPFKTAFY